MELTIGDYTLVIHGSFEVVKSPVPVPVSATTRSLFTAEQKKEIAESGGLLKVLAKKYGVSVGRISQIRTEYKRSISS